MFSVENTHKDNFLITPNIHKIHTFVKNYFNMKTDLFQAPDYFLLDELLTEEHKLIRASARAWVKKEISPIIEDA